MELAVSRIALIINRFIQYPFLAFYKLNGFLALLVLLRNARGRLC
jgi:hypothetical protein